MHLPKTNFHKTSENPVSKVFWGRVNLTTATSMYFYRKGGKVQNLIHQLKYKGHKEIGIFLGEIYGNQLMESPLYNGIDLIIPIPLHKSKLKKRGFNQAELFARGLARSMQKEMDLKSLVRQVATSTQTKKTRYRRWENVSEIFKLEIPDNITGKKILVVDDVITTGATMEAFIQTIQTVENVEVSAVSIAFASQ
ncbi:MAG: ComF family protein [Bacteroidales bacterium]|nr:ComF family protein [Bacteroidales bacterium]